MLYGLASSWRSTSWMDWFVSFLIFILFILYFYLSKRIVPRMGDLLFVSTIALANVYGYGVGLFPPLNSQHYLALKVQRQT